MTKTPKKIKSRSYTYLLPGLASIVPIKKNLLIDVFLGDFSRPLPTEPLLYCLFKFDEAETDYEESLMKHSLFVEHYDVDKTSFMCVFKYPEEYYEDYGSFLDSKFSKMSENMKKVIMKYHGLDKHSQIMLVLNKNPLYRMALEKDLKVELSEEAELGEFLNVTGEYYNNKGDT
jgi:hypothetical protein